MIEGHIQSVYGAFNSAANRWPDRDALNVLASTAKYYEIEEGALNYSDMLGLVDVYADRFDQAGYRRGMRVALLLENRPQFFVIWLALNKAGVSVVPINPDLRSAELEYLIGHAEPALIISIESRKSELIAAAKAAQIRLEVRQPDEDFPMPRDKAIVADEKEGENHEAAVLYTSGTTGNPKGCVLPNTYFLLAGNWYAGVGGLAKLPLDGERMITPLPIFHMNAMAYSFMAMVAVGGCLTVLDRFHPRSWWSDVRASRATCLHYLGVMPSMLMGLPVTTQDRKHNIRFGFGAGVDPKLQADFETRFDFPLIEAWAMTETGAGAVIAASTQERIVGRSCLGKPSPELACRLVDDQGNQVASGEAGELLVRRSQGDPRYGFFSQYYKNPQATAEAWEGGWFHTGDIVRLNANGEMFFVDRKKNVIRRSGENISAVEVESVLMKHPAIQAAGVTSVPDPVRGDEVFACLKVDQPSTDLAIRIAHWCLAQMAYYKVPGHIAFVDELPLTPTQKIQRAVLKEHAADLLADPMTVHIVELKKRQVA
jgi:acyl-CoA synthetase (AMP-forming)/AMP-acid ligase II